MAIKHLFLVRNLITGGGGRAIPPKYKAIVIFTLINDTNEEFTYLLQLALTPSSLHQFLLEIGETRVNSSA